MAAEQIHHIGAIVAQSQFMPRLKELILQFFENYPSYQLHFCYNVQEAKNMEHLAEIEHVMILHVGDPAIVEVFVDSCKNLKWIHCFLVGVDRYFKLITERLVDTDIVMTNVKGAFTVALVEYVFAAALYFNKNFPRILKSAKAGQWDVFNASRLEGKTMGFIGYGDIASQTAKVAKAFQMKTIACRNDPNKPGDQYLDAVAYSSEGGMETVFAESDFVVCSLPNTAATNNCIGKHLFSKMKPTGVFISIGRGTVVVEEDLIEILKENKIKGAALDVFQKEPLSKDSEFWGLSNFLLTPHCVDRVDDMEELALAVYEKNFKAFLNGAPDTDAFINAIDKKKGY